MTQQPQPLSHSERMARIKECYANLQKNATEQHIVLGKEIAEAVAEQRAQGVKQAKVIGGIAKALGIDSDAVRRFWKAAVLHAENAQVADLPFRRVRELFPFVVKGADGLLEVMAEARGLTASLGDGHDPSAEIRSLRQALGCGSTIESRKLSPELAAHQAGIILRKASDVRAACEALWLEMQDYLMQVEP